MYEAEASGNGSIKGEKVPQLAGSAAGAGEGTFQSFRLLIGANPVRSPARGNASASPNWRGTAIACESTNKGKGNQNERKCQLGCERSGGQVE